MRLLLATRNAGKLAELQRLLAGAVPGVEVVGLDAVGDVPDTVESGATFAENALLKARCWPPVGPADTVTTTATPRCSWASWPMFRTSGAAPRSCAPPRW